MGNHGMLKKPESTSFVESILKPDV